MEEKESPPVGLSTLPVELIDHMTSFLPNRDIKSLRLTSRSVHDSVTLRLKRVFISANPLNIRVVEQVANHERFRKGVTEIIWDETYLEWRHATPPNSKYKDGTFYFALGCPGWYYYGGLTAIHELADSKGNDAVANRPYLLDRMQRLAEAMTPGESYYYYFQLVEQERWMRRTGADWKVFEYALDRFPSLRRITISTKTYGKLFMPRYETPMIRSFPRGFIYALPAPWIFPDAHQTSRMIWKNKDTKPSNEYKVFRRGLCSALRVLAKHGKHRISEFIVEDNEWEGLGNWKSASLSGDEDPAMMDDRGCALDDLRSLIQRPGFQKLCLHQEHAEVLEKAESLRSLCFYGNGRAGMESPVMVPCRNYFSKIPECLTQQLHNLILDRVSVNKDSLVLFLGSLASLHSLELRSVGFQDQEWDQEGQKLIRLYGTSSFETYNPRNFLLALRDKTDWRQRSLRPRVVVILSKILLPWPKSQTVKLDSEISEFVYKYGKIPFPLSKYNYHPFSNWRGEDGGTPIYEYCAGKDIVRLEELDPVSERPNVDTETLEHLGIISVEQRGMDRYHNGGPYGNGPWEDIAWGNELWGNGPWGNRTCPTLKEQGRSETASPPSPSCFQEEALLSSRWARSVESLELSLDD